MHIAHVEVGVVRHRNTGDFRPRWSPGLVEPETVALVVRVETESEMLEDVATGVREDH